MLISIIYVDLYYAHRLTSLEGAMQFAQAAKRFQEQGLIKQVGLSEEPRGSNRFIKFVPSPPFNKNGVS